MIVIDIDKAQRGSVLIGRQGEHDFHQIQFVMGQWAARYPTGGVAVVYERPDGETYPVVTAARPAAVVWKPNLADLSVAGAGRLECRITTEGGLGKSATIPVSVAPAIGTAGAVPMTPIPDWTYTVADNALRAEKAATAAEAAAERVGESLPGRVVLWSDENFRLHTAEDVSDASNLITRDQLYALYTAGQAVSVCWARSDTEIHLLPTGIAFREAYGTVQTVCAASDGQVTAPEFYTAEYTPPTG